MLIQRTLVYRDECQKICGDQVRFKVKLIQEWLVTQLDTLPIMENMLDKEFSLFNNCTEKLIISYFYITVVKVFSNILVSKQKLQKLVTVECLEVLAMKLSI